MAKKAEWRRGASVEHSLHPLVIPFLLTVTQKQPWGQSTHPVATAGQAQGRKPRVAECAVKRHSLRWHMGSRLGACFWASCCMRKIKPRLHLTESLKLKPNPTSIIRGSCSAFQILRAKKIKNNILTEWKQKVLKPLWKFLSFLIINYQTTLGEFSSTRTQRHSSKDHMTSLPTERIKPGFFFNLVFWEWKGQYNSQKKVRLRKGQGRYRSCLCFNSHL